MRAPLQAAELVLEARCASRCTSAMNPCTGWLRGLSQLERIIAKGNKSEQPAVGAFTTESRTRWAQIRETLMAVRRRAVG